MTTYTVSVEIKRHPAMPWWKVWDAFAAHLEPAFRGCMITLVKCVSVDKTRWFTFNLTKYDSQSDVSELLPELAALQTKMCNPGEIAQTVGGEAPEPRWMNHLTGAIHAGRWLWVLQSCQIAEVQTV